MTGECTNCPDDFCYVCGKYSLTNEKKRITKAHERAYLAYFGIHISDQNKHWVPHFICRTCHLGLLKWWNDCGDGLNFSRPMHWQKPQNHEADCYFCVTRIDAETGKVEYANVISVTKPIPNHTKTIHTQHFISSLPVMPKYEEPHLILPNELDLLISSLDLSERSAEILVNAFNQWKILAPCKQFGHLDSNFCYK